MAEQDGTPPPGAWDRTLEPKLLDIYSTQGQVLGLGA